MKFENPILIPILSICLAFLPNAQAVNPPPDGGYPGGNTAEGQNALLSLSTGTYNTAVGLFSLLSLTTGNFNTGVGAGALLVNTADENTATGAAALLSNTTGDGNTANGTFTLFSNTIGLDNTATGAAALLSNTEGAGNTATGSQALHSNTNGTQNTANGLVALGNNTTGNSNTASGTAALGFNTTGFNNAALGDFAGSNVTTANNVICIGTDGQNVSDSCYIGNIYSNVQPIVGTDPDYVTINSVGRLGRGNVSSRRYKHDIKPMDNASEAILALKPVTFRYNKEYDTTQTLAYGLIAEDVAQVYPDLVGRNREGQPESVRYEQINAMLLNEFLKEHHKAQQQEATITQLKSTVTKEEAAIAQQRNDFEATIRELKKEMETVVVRLKEQDAKIQQVSDQIELSKPAPRTVLNDQ